MIFRAYYLLFGSIKSVHVRNNSRRRKQIPDVSKIGAFDFSINKIFSRKLLWFPTSIFVSILLAGKEVGKEFGV